MKIIVCIRQVVDPCSEYALEAALRLKDVYGGQITAISLGTVLLREAIKKPLAMGADALVLLEDEAFADGDSWSADYTLAMAIKRIASYDLVLCGRQAADRGAGQVGSGIAEILNLPSVTMARRIDVSNGRAIVERVTTDGYEVIDVPLPALITVSSEIGEPRYPTVRGIMDAKKKEPTVWKPADVGVEPSPVGATGRRSRPVTLLQPVGKNQCEFITGESPEEAAVSLVKKLREAKLLPPVAGGIRLEDASVVVAGGRGIGSADGFRELEELARLLGGAVGATRPACDNGWVPQTAQIGLSGKTVAPQLYLAVALSGSNQHIGGCSGARNIVAINKDPEANIFRVARFGIVGDWKRVLPAFTAKVRELVSA